MAARTPDHTKKMAAALRHALRVRIAAIDTQIAELTAQAAALRTFDREYPGRLATGNLDPYVTAGTPPEDTPSELHPILQDLYTQTTGRPVAADLNTPAALAALRDHISNQLRTAADPGHRAALATAADAVGHMVSSPSPSSADALTAAAAAAGLPVPGAPGRAVGEPSATPAIFYSRWGNRSATPAARQTPGR